MRFKTIVFSALVRLGASVFPRLKTHLVGLVFSMLASFSVVERRFYPAKRYLFRSIFRKKKSRYLIRSNFSYPKMFHMFAGYPVARHTKKQKILTAIIPTAPQIIPVKTSLPLSVFAQSTIFRNIFPPFQSVSRTTPF